MFGDLDWPLNASRGLSATAEFLVFFDIIDSADDDLFKQILSNPNHVLAPLLPVKTECLNLMIDNLFRNSLNFMIVISLYVCCINKCINIPY